MAFANNTDLKNKKCSPHGSLKPVSENSVVQYLELLGPGWNVLGEIKISKEFPFKGFKEAIRFVNQVAKISEKENHHPDILIFYSTVRIVLWTHFLKGLSENDFIMAAKIENAYG